MGGADYGTVRAAAFMGLALMSTREAAAHPRPPSLDGRPPGPAAIPLIGAPPLTASAGSSQEATGAASRARRVWCAALLLDIEYVVVAHTAASHLNSSSCRQSSKRPVRTAGGGYVCAVAPSLFEQAHSGALPASLSGADFLAAHGRHLDSATTVQPDTRSIAEWILTC